MMAALLPFMLSAQQKGDMYISGSIGINGGNTSTSNVKNGTSTVRKTPSELSFSIAPEFGIFVIDRLQVNISLGYSMVRSVPNGHSTETDNFYDFSNMFVISPGVRYYLPVCDKLYYTPGLSLGVGFGNEKSQISSDTLEKKPRSTFNIALSVLEFEFRPSDCLGISLSAGSLDYTLAHTKSSKEDGQGETVKYVTNKNSVSFGLNLGAKIGFKYYF